MKYKGLDFTMIAEVKTKSPFGFVSKYSWDEQFELACKIGDWISIHTDPDFGGSFNLVSKAKLGTDKRIVAKGWHKSNDDINRAFDAGADYVTIVGRFPSKYSSRYLVEPLSLAEIDSIPTDFKLIWNDRDLFTGKPKARKFEEAREIWGGWLCQASNIKSITDVHPKANAVLIGTYLREFAESIRNYQNPYFI